jgi:nucleoside-diphosphate-sugar epimerase
VFASTRQIYGRPDYLPVDEEHPINPVDINGIHKYAAEQYYQMYHNIYNIKSCILRLTNTIGPRMRIKDARQTFVGIWIRRLLEDEPIEVWGGDQLRDFNDVEDVVDALLITALTDESYGQVFNLGSEEKISLLELAQLMIDLNGSGKLKIMEFPENRSKIDIGDYYSSHKKISLLTGWKPERSLSHTLEKTLQFYKSNLALYR